MADDRGDVGALAPFVGEWTIEAEFPPPVSMSGTGRTSFEWLHGRHYLLQRTAADHPDAPDGLMVITPDSQRPGAWVQHYFDSRGVVRLYLMTFDGRTWELTRTSPDFSPLDFAQRYTGRFSAAGDTITGRWETATDGEDWQLDFHLTYHRTA